MNAKEAGSEFTRIFEITETLSDQAKDLSPPYKTLIGDDAAILNSQDLKLTLFASDMMVENIHFRTSYFNEADIGYKSMATNVSDMAAMAGYPLYATISLACPRSFAMLDFYAGVKEACQEYGFHIAGGDLSSSALIVVSVAMLGGCHKMPIRRSTARPGDYIFITGPVGGSATGLANLERDPLASNKFVDMHRRPKARVREALAAAQAEATAMIDVSDGLLADLNHICQDSSLGALLTDIPVIEGASMEAGLYGGEDYELIICHPNPDGVYEAFDMLELERPFMFGRLTDRAGIMLNGMDLNPRGYQHDL